MRLMLHIHHSTLHGFERVVVISNDTNVVTILLYFTSDFIDFGGKEIWVLHRTWEKEQCLLSHTLFLQLAQTKCKTIFKAHTISSCDVTNKFGTKPAALHAQGEKYLLKICVMKYFDSRDRNICWTLSHQITTTTNTGHQIWRAVFWKVLLL